MLKSQILLYHLLITPLVNFRCHFFLLLLLHSARYICPLKWYCNSLNIILAFSSFNVKNLISVKDCVPKSVCSCVICNFSDIFEKSHHLSTQVHEHLFADTKSYIFTYLKILTLCRDACGEKCFKIRAMATGGCKGV